MKDPSSMCSGLLERICQELELGGAVREAGVPGSRAQGPTWEPASPARCHSLGTAATQLKLTQPKGRLVESGRPTNNKSHQTKNIPCALVPPSQPPVETSLCAMGEEKSSLELSGADLAEA